MHQRIPNPPKTTKNKPAQRRDREDVEATHPESRTKGARGALNLMRRSLHRRMDEEQEQEKEKKVEETPQEISLNYSGIATQVL
ncbi:hypothetical protein CEXT_603471 [Caerostris extrusa]|uniref:Uncharacterized protein n=1 Tax=Caerostris extrusa TaxID=172846 RepID=A0AAV4PVN3_CAEEX|nr:hypothetical protein CEXT_603471 [Caerostris extrusa]